MRELPLSGGAQDRCPGGLRFGRDGRHRFWDQNGTCSPPAHTVEGVHWVGAGGARADKDPEEGHCIYTVFTEYRYTGMPVYGILCVKI